MELNYDCFRSVLIALEKNLSLDEKEGDVSFSTYDLDQLHALNCLKKYSPGELFYAVYNLKQAGYIKAVTEFGSDILCDCYVTDITFEGHMFLKSVRDDNLWKAVKSAVGKIGTASIPVLLNTAKELAMKTIFPT